ncbi:uncharacterized protein LOC124690580 [Lolium rigidum]|uniref:uncharacterized protein LOC124690580 n=1 Tax=Lolium rigidum TaxID=89674 RepID=UPI001F5DF6EA|nr:uncharacterized protein LOC124690580 [Lolium rigidum]
MVDDVQSLDTEWVISSNPYPIRLTLRQIRNILKVDEYMDANCFNMAVRILACHDIQLVRDIPVHYMDLNFCWMSQYARDPRRNEKLDITKLSHLFECWPDSNEYHISEYNMDDIEMRRQFVVHILKYEGNEALNNIPAMERSIIDDIRRWTFMKEA